MARRLLKRSVLLLFAFIASVRMRRNRKAALA